MKTVTIDNYKALPDAVHMSVLHEGEIYCVNCKGDGKFVLVEESEFQTMYDALRTVLAAANMDDETYKAVQRAAKAAGIKGSFGNMEL